MRRKVDAIVCEPAELLGKHPPTCAIRNLHKPVDIGTMRFRTQTAAVFFFRELLNSQPLKVPIPEPHHSFLCDLLSAHPRAKEKVGTGIQCFTVEHALHGTRCFYITRVDGSRTDFSFYKYVRGRE